MNRISIWEQEMTLMGLDTFRDVDRVVEQAMGATRATRAVPIEAFRRRDEYVVALDLPGVDRNDIDIKVERNVVTVRATRRSLRQPDDEILIDERPKGEFVRRLYLGDSLDSKRLTADFANGVLTLTIPVDESSKPRTVSLGSSTADDSSSLRVNG
jgi:HSP20 family protein